MKDSPISKLIITKTGYQPTQYKKVIDTLPVLCADKNYQSINDIIWNRINLVAADFSLTYPDANQWYNIHYVEIRTANLTNIPVADGSRTPTITMARKTHFCHKSPEKVTIGIQAEFQNQGSRIL